MGTVRLWLAILLFIMRIGLTNLQQGADEAFIWSLWAVHGERGLSRKVSIAWYHE